MGDARHFQQLSPPPFTMGAGSWPLILKLWHNIQVWLGQIFDICPSLCVTWLWTWQGPSVAKSRPLVPYRANLFPYLFMKTTYWVKSEEFLWAGCPSFPVNMGCLTLLEIYLNFFYWKPWNSTGILPGLLKISCCYSISCDWYAATFDRQPRDLWAEDM